MSEIFALDIETTGLNRFQDKILAIGVFNPVYKYCFRSIDDFRRWNENHPNAVYVMHNGAFDVGFLRNIGIDLRSRWVFDTRSCASIINPRPESLGLEYLAKTYLNKESYKLDRTRMDSYSFEELSNYCLTDCQYTYELYQYLLKTIDLNFAERWLMPATLFCADMEYDGVYVDKEGLRAYQMEMVAKRDQLLTELKELAKAAIMFYHEKQVQEVSKTYKEMYEKAKAKISVSKYNSRLYEKDAVLWNNRIPTREKDQKEKEAKCVRRYALLEASAISRLEPFNWNSPKQLIWLLKDYYHLTIENRDSEDSTSEAVLRSLDHPVPKKLCDYRETEKLVSTCIPALTENIQADGFVHTHYHIGGTRTGRLSSSGPNLQQIPRGTIRSFIRAAPQRSDYPRHLVTIDYGQIEVRIIAELAKEKELIHAFKEGIDPYSVIAHKLLKIDCDLRLIKEKFKKERDVSKTAGLSILYGTGAGKLQEVLNKELNKNYSLQECRQFIKEYREGFPAIARFKQQLEQKLANKKVYYNLLGRPFIIEDNDMLYMRALNTLVQGSASDLVVWSQTQFVIPALKALKVPFKHRMIIHDEVVIELPADEAELLVKEVIEPAMTTSVEKALNMETPLKIEYGIAKVWHKP